jgi:hypothetical protein
MRRNQHIVIGSILAIGCLSPIGRSFAQCRGSIDGRVVDERGNPVAGALVSLSAHGQPISHKAVKFSRTESDGSFHATLDLEGPGSYWVLAKKEEDGHPDTRMAFYNDLEPQLVVVDCGGVVSGVVVELGPKAAHITRISVIDVDTGKAIENATITMRRSFSPVRKSPSDVLSISTSAVLMAPSPSYLGLAVPANVDITYQITAPGYAPSTEETLHLAPLRQTELTVTLRRSSSTAAQLP